MSINAGKATGYLIIDSSGWMTGLNNAGKQYNSFLKNVENSATPFQALNTIMNGVGRTMTTAITLPLLTMGSKMVQTAADFEHAMKRVQAISGSTGAEFEMLSVKAVQLGADTIYTASESAAAMEMMAKAGWSAQDMMAGLEGVMMAATATGSDLAVTADILVSTLNAFGKEAGDAGQVADVLAMAANRTNIDMTDLGEAFKYIGPTAHNAGISLEEVTATLGVLGDAGIKGSQAGTSLRSALVGLYDPTKEASEIMEKYDINMRDAVTGAMLPFADQVMILQDRLQGVDKATRDYILSNLYGQRAITSMSVLMNEGSASINELTQALYESEGESKRAADVMMDSLHGSMELLKGSSESLAINIGSVLAPKIREIVTTVDKWVQAFDSLSPEMKNMVVGVVGFVAAVGPLTMIIAGIVDGYGKWKDTMTTVKSALSGLTTEELKNIATKQTLGQALQNAKDGYALQSTELKRAIVDQQAAVIVNTAETTSKEVQSASILKVVATRALELVQLAAYKVAMAAATAAAIAHNAAMSLAAAPLAAFAIAIGAIVVAYAAWNEIQRRMSPEFKEQQAALASLRAEAEASTQSYNSATQSFASTRAEMERNSVSLDRMINKQSELADYIRNTGVEASRGTAEWNEYNRVSSVIADKLGMVANRAEDLASGMKVTTGEIKEQKKQWDEYNAAMQIDSELETQAVELEVAMAKLQSVCDTYGISVNNAIGGMYTQNQMFGEQTQIAKDLAPWLELIDQLQGDMALNEQARAALGAAVAQQKEENARLEAAALRELAEQWNMSTAEMEAAANRHGMNTEEYGVALANAYEQMKTDVSDMVTTTVNNFQRLATDSYPPLNEMLENLRYNEQMMQEWNDGLMYLVGINAPQELVKILYDAGPQGKEAVDAIVAATKELPPGVQLNVYDAISIARAACPELWEVFEEMQAGSEQRIKDGYVLQGYIGRDTGLALDAAGADIAGNTATQDAMYNNTTETGERAEVGINEAQYVDKGKRMVEEQQEGVESAQAALWAAMENAVSQTVEAAKGASVGWISIGFNMVTGMADGVRQGSGILNSAIVKVVKDAVAAAKAAAEENSPSKLFKREVGYGLSEGIAVGVEDMGYKVNDAISDVVLEAAKLANSTAMFTPTAINLLEEASTNIRRSSLPVDPIPVQAVATLGRTTGVGAEESTGDTYNFYGVETSDPVEIERRLRQIERERNANLL